MADVAARYNHWIKATLVIQSHQHVLTIRVRLHQLFVSITFVSESQM